MTTGGTANEELPHTLLAGTYYVRIAAQEAGASTYVFRYGVNAPDPDEVARLQAQMETQTGSEAPQQAPTESGAQQTETSAEYSADTGTAGRVAPGGSIASEIERAGDRDWFAVELVAGRTYVFDLEGSPTGAGTLGDTFLRGIHDANGNLISGTANDDGGSSTNSRVTFTATETGTHYVAAGAYSNFGTGTYELSVTDTTPEAVIPEPQSEFVDGEPLVAAEAHSTDEFSQDTGTTGRVAVGGSASGEIDVTRGNSHFGGQFSELVRDHDWFAVELVAGRTYAIDQEGWATHVGTNRGPYYRRFIGDDFDNEELRDPHLRGIHDSTGNLIAGTTDDDSGKGLNSQVIFTATESGTHYIAAGADGANAGSHFGDYRLFVNDITLAVGDSATGEIEWHGQRGGFINLGESGSGNEFFRLDLPDRDLYAVELREGARYQVDVGGVASVNEGYAGGTARDPFVAVFDHDADLSDQNDHTRRLHRNDDGGPGRDAAISFTADRTGLHYIEVRENGTYLANGTHYVSGSFIGGTDDFGRPYSVQHLNHGPYSGVGTYTVSLRWLTSSEPSGVDFADDESTGGFIRIGDSVTGNIDRGADKDWFAIDLVSGKTYRVDARGSEASDPGGTLADPQIVT